VQFHTWIKRYDDVFAEAARRHGRRLVELAPSRVRTDDRWALVKGRQSAEALRDWFYDQVGPERDPSVLAAQLAMEVNEFPARLVAKNTLTDKLRQPSRALASVLLAWADHKAHAGDVLAAAL
jgi:hypothetical protein